MNIPGTPAKAAIGKRAANTYGDADAVPTDSADEVEAPAPAPKAAKTKPAPVVEDDDAGEPEVRKAAPKAPAVPAKKSKLADIVSDWDDE